MTLQTDRPGSGVRNDRAIGHVNRTEHSQQMGIVGRDRDAVRFVARLAPDRAEYGIRSRRSVDAPNETIGGMAPHARPAGWTRGSTSGIRVTRDIPFRAFDMMRWGIVTLIAIAGIQRLGNHVRVAERKCVLAARSMAVFALDIRHIAERRRHGGPICVGKRGRERPPRFQHDVVKSAVGCRRRRVVADGMAFQAGRAVAAEITVDAVGTDRCVTGVQPRFVRIFRHDAAAMAERAGTGPHIRAGGDSLADIRAPAPGSHNRGHESVLPRHIGAEQGAPRHAIQRPIHGFVNGNVGAQRTGHEVRDRRGRRVGQGPGHAQDVGGGNGTVYLGIEIHCRSHTDGSQAARYLGGGGKLVNGYVAGGHRPQDKLAIESRCGRPEGQG